MKYLLRIAQIDGASHVEFPDDRGEHYREWFAQTLMGISAAIGVMVGEASVFDPACIEADRINGLFDTIKEEAIRCLDGMLAQDEDIVERHL